MAGHKTDLTGQRFTRLIVVSFAGINKHGNKLWLCKCDCGGDKITSATCLKGGKTGSCGCLKRERISAANKKHGKSTVNRTGEYISWNLMRDRCNNTNHKNYSRYGGRGISVCARWDDFENFLKDVGLRPSPKHSLDRIDTDGNYEPGNCRWSTQTEQMNNMSRNKFIKHNGKTQTHVQWARELGTSPASIYYHITVKKRPFEEVYNHFKNK